MFIDCIILTPDEIRLISRPYSLVTSRKNPCCIHAPDLSNCYFNKMFGLGNPEHNRRVREEREHKRPQRDTKDNLLLWGIWNKYNGNSEEYYGSFEEKFNASKAKPRPNLRMKEGVSE